MTTRSIRIGTRGSKLALWQADWIKAVLKRHHPDLYVDIRIIKTTGDKILDVPLAKVGGKGLFVKEIETALLEGGIDLAVHSMKDMPAALPPGLIIGAVPERENPFDAFIAKNDQSLPEQPIGMRIGTSSLRRAAQIKAARPDAVILPLRGNVQTRLQKLDDGMVDATILAVAGIRRMELEDRISQTFTPDILLPAVGQGALCVEIRENDPETAALVSSLNHRKTRIRVTCERAFLHRLEGGCQVPMAAFAECINGQLKIEGLVASVDGKNIIRDTVAGTPKDSEKLGIQLADSLISKGAKTILSIQQEPFE